LEACNDKVIHKRQVWTSICYYIFSETSVMQPAFKRYQTRKIALWILSIVWTFFHLVFISLSEFHPILTLQYLLHSKQNCGRIF